MIENAKPFLFHYLATDKKLSTGSLENWQASWQQPGSTQCHSPVGADANIMHVELDGFRLLLVFEMIISQEVVELIHHWRGGICPFWKAGYLARERASSGEVESSMRV